MKHYTSEEQLRQAREYLREGQKLFHQQRYDEAVAPYEKALKLQPDDPYAWGLKGYALFRAGRVAESIDANQRALKLDPGNPLAYLNLAKSYCAAKQYVDAERVFVKDPPADVASHLKQYVVIDGELRRLCKPILASLKQASAP